ncbi:MAG: rhomboid family intramembrane serine protease [Bacteroidaceae bacterium]|nr:rhomboid family intramembrane serine protease [Bacteroidaceae bacterium]
MNFNTPPITKNLIIINLLMYLGKVVAARYGISFDDLLGLHFFLASDFKLYQLFTYLFVHGGLDHIFFNMFTLWMFGRMMEQVMGSQRFLFYYLFCGVGAGLMQEGVQYIEYMYQGLANFELVNVGGLSIPMDTYLNQWTTVGASGAIYGVLLSFGMTFPNERMFIIPIPFPIKAKWFVLGFTVIELMSALGNPGDNVAHMAHLGGMLFGLALILYWRKHPGGGSGRFFGGGGYGGYGGYGGSDNYYTRYEDVTNTSSRGSLWNSIQQWFTDLKGSIAKLFRRKPKMEVHVGGKHSDDMEWNRQQKEKEAEVDRILAKVKQGGYESLTSEEKRTLFENTR